MRIPKGKRVGVVDSLFNILNNSDMSVKFHLLVRFTECLNYLIGEFPRVFFLVDIFFLFSWAFLIDAVVAT